MDDMRLEIGVDPDGVQVIAGPERIVRALAAADPLDVENGECVFCARLGKYVVPYTTKVEDHYPTCPWRLATEWVAANPGSEQGG